MLPRDMKLKIKTGTVGYNNKILVSDEKFSLGKNVEVLTSTPRAPGPAMKSIARYNNKILLSDGKNHKVNALKPAAIKSNKNSKVIEHSTTTQGLAITHEVERATLILFLTGGFTMWFMFR